MMLDIHLPTVVAIIQITPHPMGTLFLVKKENEEEDQLPLWSYTRAVPKSHLHIKTLIWDLATSSQNSKGKITTLPSLFLLILGFFNIRCFRNFFNYFKKYMQVVFNW